MSFLDIVSANGGVCEIILTIPFKSTSSTAENCSALMQSALSRMLITMINFEQTERELTRQYGEFHNDNHNRRLVLQLGSKSLERVSSFVLQQEQPDKHMLNPLLK